MANANSINVIRNVTLTTASTTATFVPAVTSGTTRAILSVPPNLSNGLFDGTMFRVRATGSITTGGNYAHTLALYWNSNNNTDLTTTTSDVLIGTSGAVTINTATKSFILTADLIWDSTTKLITGDYKAIFAGVIQNSTPKALDAITSAPTTVGGLQFSLLSTFGTAHASNSLFVREFAIDQV